MTYDYDINGLYQLLDIIQANKDVKTKGTSYLETCKGYDRKFTGVTSEKEFFSILTKGDDNIKNQLLVGTTILPTKDTKTYTKDTTGLFFDIGDVIEGVPECYYKNDLKITDIERIEIKLRININSKVKINTVIDNAKQLIKDVLKLESKKVNIRVVIYSLSVRPTTNIRLVLKDYGQPINYESLSGVLHPSCNRVGFFRLKELLYKKKAHPYGIVNIDDETIIGIEDYKNSDFSRKLNAHV